VESQTTFIGAESRVKLNTEAVIDLEVALVIFPHDAELDDALRDGGDTESNEVLRVLLEEGAVLERRLELLYACWNSFSTGMFAVKVAMVTEFYRATDGFGVGGRVGDGQESC